MALYLNNKHIISKPSPIFTKIEQSDIEKYKVKYGASQSTTTLAENKPKLVRPIGEIEKAIEMQGNKVRELKKKGTQKNVLQPDISLLLALKQELEETKKELNK